MQMDCGWTRFSMLQQRLDSITPRALSLTLKQMMSVNLVQRRLEDGFPPHPLYSLTSRGLDLAHIITH
jgi:DNA-binding HxlR family transcriptional regulator